MNFQNVFVASFLVVLSSVSGLASASAGSAPNCDRAYPSTNVLWPANHKFNTVTINGLDGADVAVQCITQDEPLNSQGDGNTEYDAQGIGTAIASLRAERAGGGNGRVYHINYLASNTYGQCYGQVKVGVPPSKKKAVTDDGELYVSVPNPIQCGGEPANKPPVFTSRLVLQRSLSPSPYLSSSHFSFRF